MTPKRQRMIFILIGLASLGIAVALILNAFRDNLVFFYSPTEIQAKHPVGVLIRIGGLVKEGSIQKSTDSLTTAFVLTDLKNDTTVHYKGLLPNLFREGQGIVAHGKLDASGIFIADELLAKHDEKYMPPEVADALKKSGEWRPDTQTGQKK